MVKPIRGHLLLLVGGCSQERLNPSRRSWIWRDWRLLCFGSSGSPSFAILRSQRDFSPLVLPILFVSSNSICFLIFPDGSVQVYKFGTSSLLVRARLAPLLLLPARPRAAVILGGQTWSTYGRTSVQVPIKGLVQIVPHFIRLSGLAVLGRLSPV